jgi:thioesterase domain-containing protein
MGGRVAYEMARQLEARGERVALLAIIDARGSEEVAETEPATETRVEQAVFEFAEHLSRLSGLHPRAAEVLEQVDAVELKSVLEGRAHPLGEEAAAEEVRALWRMYARNRTASRTYEPKPYGGSLVLLRAAEGPKGQEKDLGWGALARGGVEVHEVPGDHFSLIAMPHVEHLAARLRELLKRAVTGGTLQQAS